jgi:hypothetical protein
MNHLLVMPQQTKAQRERDQEAMRITRLLLKRTSKKADKQEPLSSEDQSKGRLFKKN